MYSAFMHLHLRGKGGTETESEKPQATEEVFGGASVCFGYQAGVQIPLLPGSKD